MVVPPAILRVILKPGRERPFLDGHPWVLSGAVERTEGPTDAPLARVESATGRVLGMGFASPRSQIRVRLLGADPGAVDRAFFAARLAEAAALRAAVVPPDTTGYRLLNAEGDGVPGWTVDRYGDVLVSQITVAALESLRAEAYAALLAAHPEAAVVQANDLKARRLEGLPLEDEVVAGQPPAAVAFEECGLELTAELAGGQKTGFYLDQRDSRRRVETLAGGRSVLDLFAHTGAFGLYALRGGATRVVHVESSSRLVMRGKQHYRANSWAEAAAEWRQANVFEALRAETDRFDLVVVDPPPLVPRRSHLEAGARAYKDLNRLAFRVAAPGGFVLTFTCSGAVDGRLFRQVLFQAAREARVRVLLLSPLGAAPDHPVAITHPEGEYLKGWLLRVVGPDL
jgi:23S rRNA (cytosine1962-C5)-methyltransferase